MRINGFEQIKGFYSWVFENQDKRIRTTHISLYMFLINQNNRNNWVEWFKCPFDLAMSGSGITNKKTYYNTLLELQDWKLIQYKKGINNYKAPLIKIEVLFDTSIVPQSEPQLQPQVIPLPEPLLLPQLLPNIKLVTSNIKRITLNIESVLDFLEKKDNTIPSFNIFKEYALEKKKNVCVESLRLKYESWVENDWKNGKGEKIKNWKSTLLNTLPYIKEKSSAKKEKDKQSAFEIIQQVKKGTYESNN